MATIQDYLNQIKDAIYGKDVRQAIHDGIQQCYYDGKAGSTDLEARQRLDSAEGSLTSLGSRMSTAENDIDVLDSRVDQIVAPSGEAPSAAEVADARVGDDEVTYGNLGDAIRTQFSDVKYVQMPNADRLVALDGQVSIIPTDFDIGNIGISTSGWSYGASATRVRTKQGTTIHLNKGAKIGLLDYSDARFYLGWKKSDDTYGAVGWLSEDYLTVEEGDYVILITNKTEVSQNNNKHSLLDLLFIKQGSGAVQDLKNIENNMMGIQNGNQTFSLYADFVNGTLNQGVIGYTIKYRVTEDEILSFDRPLNITIKSGFRLAYHTFSTNGTWIGASPWQIDSVTIPANTRFKLLIARTTEDSSEIADINTFVNAITFPLFIDYALPPTALNVNPCFKSIAHQGYSTSSRAFGDSRISSYIGAYRHGFDCAETDIQWSSDGIAVCCHDETFVDATSGNTITIANETLEQLKTHNYYGETIASLEEVVLICKLYGLKLVIDKVSGDWTDAQWNHIFYGINKFQMRNNVFWTCPNDTAKQKILNFNSEAILIVLCNANQLSSAVNTAIFWEGQGAHIWVACNYEGLEIEDMIDASIDFVGKNIDMGLWTIDSLEDYEDFMPYCNFIYSNKLCGRDIYQ